MAAPATDRVASRPVVPDGSPPPRGVRQGGRDPELLARRRGALAPQPTISEHIRALEDELGAQLLEDECRAGLLHCVKVKDLRVARAFYLVTHRERSRSPLTQAFVDFVESEPLERPS